MKQWKTPHSYETSARGLIQFCLTPSTSCILFSWRTVRRFDRKKSRDSAEGVRRGAGSVLKIKVIKTRVRGGQESRLLSVRGACALLNFSVERDPSSQVERNGWPMANDDSKLSSLAHFPSSSHPRRVVPGALPIPFLSPF